MENQTSIRLRCDQSLRMQRSALLILQHARESRTPRGVEIRTLKREQRTTCCIYVFKGRENPVKKKYWLIILALVWIAALANADAPVDSRTAACAHRGDCKVAPENTLPAIVSAVQKGAAMIEFDVQKTKDGHLVIMHDTTVDRTTNGKGRVSDLTFAEIRALDAGSWFSPEFAGTQVPTLEEVLDVIPPGILCNVHLKNTPGLAEDAARLIRDKGRLADCFFACSEEQILEARDTVPEIMTCNMTRQMGNRALYVENTIKIGAQFIQFIRDKSLEGIGNDVARCHAYGIRVNFFSAQDVPTIRMLAETGVDYILTDNLDLCMQALAEFHREKEEQQAAQQAAAE